MALLTPFAKLSLGERTWLWGMAEVHGAVIDPMAIAALKARLRGGECFSTWIHLLRIERSYAVSLANRARKEILRCVKGN